MLEKINGVLKRWGLMLPDPVKHIFREMGEEIDRLRAEVTDLRSKIEKE